MFIPFGECPGLFTRKRFPDFYRVNGPESVINYPSRRFDFTWILFVVFLALGRIFDFHEAHFSLSRGAANYFGTNLDGKLGKVKTFVGPGEVKSGELKVIETLEDEK